MGLDGRIFPVGTKPTDTGSMFADDWFPIQVKQTDKVGRACLAPPPLSGRGRARMGCVSEMA